MSSDERLFKLYQKLHQQNVRDKQDRQDWEEILKEVDGRLAESRTVTSFRRHFKRWREQTSEGRGIKEKLFTDQDGKCFKCQEDEQIERLEVHHLAPLALLQRYADQNPDKWADLLVFVTSPKYLRLVHPLCNKQFAEQVIDLKELKFLSDFSQQKR